MKNGNSHFRQMQALSCLITEDRKNMGTYTGIIVWVGCLVQKAWLYYLRV